MASPGGIEVSRVSVRVVPDTSHLLADLKADLADIEARTSLTVRTQIDTTSLDADARAAVDQAQLAAGDLKIHATVDRSQIDELENSTGSALRGVGGLTSGLGALATAAILLGPALIPIVGVLGGVAAALAAPVAVVGGGLTLFGFLAGFAIKDTNEQLKKISTAQGQLDKLTKGTAAYAAALANLRALQAGLTPAQRQFAAALVGLKSAFTTLGEGIVLTPVTAAINLLTRLLPLLQPVVRVTSRVLTDLIGGLAKQTNTPGFKSFVKTFASDLGRYLRTFAKIASNVFRGLFGLFGVLTDGLTGPLLRGLVDVTGRFADFGKKAGQNEGLKNFVAYLKQNGPPVAKALGDIAVALGAVVTALAPIGPPVLAAVDHLARGLSSIPTHDLTAAAIAIAALVGGLQLLGPLQGVVEAAIAAPELALVVAGLAGLALGFIGLYNQSKPFRNILHDIGDYFQKTWLPKIQDAAHDILPALSGAFRDISKSIRENKPFLEAVGKAVVAIGSVAAIASLKQLAIGIRVFGKAVAAAITIAHLFADVQLAVFQVVLRGLAVFVQTATQQFGVFIDSATAAFGWVPKIGPKLKAADANFHKFTNGIVDHLNSAADHLQSLQHQIDAFTAQPYKIKFTVDDIAAIKELQRLRNTVDRAVGPGGGIGFPSGPNAAAPDLTRRSSGAGGSGAGASRTSAGITIQNATFTDAKDLSRQGTKWMRGRAGGGVNLTPSPAIGGSM